MRCRTSQGGDAGQAIARLAGLSLRLRADAKTQFVPDSQHALNQVAALASQA